MNPKVYSLLDKLWKKHGAHEFGKICQIFVGLSLCRLQFQIRIFQLCGRPDIIAMKNNEEFAFEVKTQSGPLATIKPEDLKGVRDYPKHAIISVLSYPDLDCAWIIARADNIKAGKWPISLLKQHSIHSLENEVNNTFPEVLEEYFSYAELGTSVLYARLKDNKNYKTI